MTTPAIPGRSRIIKRPVSGRNLKTGMTVYRYVDSDKPEQLLKVLTGKCEHGLHFDNHCYDYISTWWVEPR